MAESGAHAAGSGSDVAVEARELTRTFGDFTAVDRVSFRVATGEIFGFLGPNGAGKTTTIRMLTGLLPPSGGRAVVAGLDVAAERRAVKRRIGYMSQLFSLYEDLTVVENVDFFNRLYGVPRERRDARRRWALETAELAGHRDRLTGDLPLGWKQRLALTCAMLHEPPILFLDEPTSGVDPGSRRDFWDLIYGLADDGTTVFVTTHYMEEAEYCNRLALMNRGRLIALDTPDGLRDAMEEPLLEVRAEDAPRAADLLGGLEGVVEASLFGRVVHVVVREPGREEALRRRLADAEVAVESIRRVEPALEDVFVARVRAEGGAPVE